MDVLNFAYHIRRIVLEQSKRAHVGHVGSALSIADLVAALYANVLRIRDPHDGDRDRFVLCKGHAALAVYAALFLKGWITKAELNTYCGEGSMLGVHPEYSLPGIDFCTGSLGQGLSMGVGSALASRMQGSGRRVFALVSDAECNEGALWEAAMFAAHHSLTNLVAIVDLNGQQALGYTGDVMDLAPMGERWRAFGWDVHDVDGHEPAEVTATIDGLNPTPGRPHVLIANTVFGRGVSFMESRIEWHYLPMSETEYKLAMNEIGAPA